MPFRAFSSRRSFLFPPVSWTPFGILAHRLRIAWGLSLVAAQLAAAPLVSWPTEFTRFDLEANGSWSGVVRRTDGRNLLGTNVPAPLLSLRVQGALHPPDQARWDAASGELTLGFTPAGLTARVRVQAQTTHLRLELLEVLPAGRADLALWGPYPITLRQTVGEVVGVVRDTEFAVGLQALNSKTLGGYPENDEGSADRPYAARQTEHGSVLQAYAMDRSRLRSIAVWNRRAPNMPVPPIPGETVTGSKIALFGCPEPQVLTTLGQIEVAEGLPHPLIDGVWAKVSQERGRSYLIASFSESDVEEILAHVKRANLMSLYHGGPFKSWGHYEPSPKYFPHGVAGVKACAEKARALGIRLGAHTLSNFIQTDDPYVTPVPDPRLAKTGFSRLTGAVDAETTTIPVGSPEYFTNKLGNELQTVVIGQELVRYRSVSGEAPWQLLDCQRGAYGTRAAGHESGAEVGKLMDHAYKVFFPNLEMQREIARNLARRFNETGLSHMDFDGHEGCLAPGEGTYGNEVFAEEFYRHLDHTVINGTSPPLSHYYWHINSYCNWGEPWYGGFRDSMQEYRINNQAFCERNYLPKMLGWYLLTTSTCLSDMEWMLARAAGFDAGFALATSPEALRRNPETGRILDAIREWELVRRSGRFTAEQREQLRNPKREFHLEPLGADGWDWFPFHDSPEFTHEAGLRQPGEPVFSRWEVVNPDGLQTLKLKLRVLGKEGAVVNPTWEVDRAATLRVPVELQAGQTLLVEEDGLARVYDAKGSQVKSVPLTGKLPQLRPGANQVQFEAEFPGEAPPKVSVTFKTKGKPVRIGK
jgi:hypothetical protein